MTRTTTRIAVVGTGPRGIAVALRLLDDRPRREGDVELHLVDPVPGGAVWRPEQDQHLLMNSRGRQATVYADGTVPGVDGGSRGPSFIEWARTVAPTLPLPPEQIRQAAALGDDGFASRALFGAYLRWVLGDLVASHPGRVRVHAARAVDLEETPSGAQRIVLDDGKALEFDAVVLALGHLPMPATADEIERAAFAARHGLTYLRPAVAQPGPLEALRPGERVVLLGAGLNFYDVTALVTEGRGGRFEADADGRLRYEASGREPVLLVASGRGVPYMARATHPLAVALEVLDDDLLAEWSAAAGTLSFARDVWPVLVEEMTLAWTGAGGDRAFDLDALIDPFAAALAGLGPHAPRSSDELSAVLQAILEADAESASATPRGAQTAVGETLAVLKDRVRALVAAGAFDAESVRDDLGGWFRSVGAFIAAGPPLRRVREAVALLDAGVLRALGADARLALDESTGAFSVTTRELPDPVRVTAVVEARLPAEDARTTSDPLVAALRERGLARAATLPGSTSATEGLEVVRTTAATLLDGTACRLVAADGTASKRRLLLGLPVQPQEWNIANLPQPGRGDRTLTQAESIAAQIDRLGALRPGLPEQLEGQP